ncbi:MAG: hypothetical protein WC516_07550 [Patescibacteria group bacterium]
MTPERWQQTKVQIQNTFKDAEITKENLEEPEKGEREIVLFDGPLGQMKLEYLVRPVVLEKRTHGSRRIGSQPEVEYIYSKDEFSHQMKAYKWDESQDDWLEIDLRGSFGL